MQYQWWPVYLTFYACACLLFEASKDFRTTSDCEIMTVYLGGGHWQVLCGTIITNDLSTLITTLSPFDWRLKRRAHIGIRKSPFSPLPTQTPNIPTVYRKRSWFCCLMNSLFLVRLQLSYTGAYLPLSISKRISAGMLLRHDFLYSAITPVNGRKLNPLSVPFYSKMYYPLLVC